MRSDRSAVRSPIPPILPVLLLSFAFLTTTAAPAPGQTSPVPDNVQIEEVATGFQFTEGPYWHPDGFLLFSDIPANTVYRWTPGEGTDVHRRPSGNANGITADGDGHLILAQHAGRVSLIGSDGREQVLAHEYRGQRLNSPNDVVVHEDGAVYFTDPPYGVSDENRELDQEGVYRLDGTGRLELLTDEFVRPNGLIFAPDYTTLYVNDSQENIIRAYDVESDGTLTNGRLFAEPSDPDASGGTDGMKIDQSGRLYTTGPGGIWIYGPNGDRVDRIVIDAQCTNLAFGGSDRSTLYVTTPSTVYSVELDATGIHQQP